MIAYYLPLAGILLLAIIGLVVRPAIQLRRYGTSGILLFRGGTAQNARDALLVLLVAGFIGHAIVGPSSHALTRLLVTQGSALYAVLQMAGALLIVAGTALFAAAQINLGASWRIGIDPHSAPGVVSSGLYELCRHPIFLGFLMVFTGYAAMLPTPVAIGMAVAGFLVLRTQAEAEEAYMLRTYGEPYRRYAEHVGRFVPGLGKGIRTPPPQN